MLSNYEHRILGELEFEFSRSSSRLPRLARACRLPVAMTALVVAIVASAVADLPQIAATLLCACLGVIVGWQLVAVVRRNVMGPRIRRRLGISRPTGTSVRRQR